jgi:hypothetical protein
MNNLAEIKAYLQKEMVLQTTDHSSMEELREKLAAHINQLIVSDFERLVSLLYRIDVSEKKLTHLLETNRGTQAGQMIADLIIERQIQKIASREQFRNSGDSIDEEKW